MANSRSYATIKQCAVKIAITTFLKANSELAFAMIGSERIGHKINRVMPENGFTFICMIPTITPIIPQMQIDVIKKRTEKAIRNFVGEQNRDINMSRILGMYTCA